MNLLRMKRFNHYIPLPLIYQEKNLLLYMVKTHFKRAKRKVDVGNKL